MLVFGPQKVEVSLQLKNSRLFIIMVVLGVFVVIGGINFFYVDRRRKLV